MNIDEYLKEERALIEKRKLELELEKKALSKQKEAVELIVFTNTGKTYLFKEITNFTHTTQGFSFEYTGLSTGITRKAEFNYTSVAGYAIN